MPISNWVGANLEHLKKQAKELREAIERGEPEALARVDRHLPAGDRHRAAQLSQAQHVLARERGFDSWPKLKAHVEAQQLARERVQQATARAWTRADQALDEFGGLIDPSHRAAGVKACLDGDLPLLPVRDAVLFPGASAPFAVGRPSSLALVEALAQQELAFVAVFCQRDAGVHHPTARDLLPAGVLACVHAIVPVPGQATMLFLDGLERVELVELTAVDPYLRASVAVRPDGADERDCAALVDALRDTARRTLALMPGAPPNAQSILDRIAQPAELVDAIAANLDAPQVVKGALLGTATLFDRLQKLLDLLRAQLSVLEAQRRAVG